MGCRKGLWLYTLNLGIKKKRVIKYFTCTEISSNIKNKLNVYIKNPDKKL